MTYFMNTGCLMNQLSNEVQKLNIAMELKEIRSFDEIDEKVIFNCSGLGAIELNRDSNMIPVRGHLILLNEKAGSEHMDYILYGEMMQDGTREDVYIIPKNISVTPDHPEGRTCAGSLGGTFIPLLKKMTPAEETEFDRREFERLLDRNSLFFHGHPFQ